ncbi:MAG: LysE family transporter [Gammaproteobacteria bacterium]|jgi:threonine/homoserine/homoserine lactone efflux protein|nr:LysE family transporter [Gammaproteobacteria bacterium]
MSGLLFYFLVGLLVCFVGTIPFGPINLTVVKTTVDLNKTRGLEVALAASLVEILEALVAISFGAVISIYLESSLSIRLFIAIAFIALGIIVLTRKSRVDPINDSAVEPDYTVSQFKKGLIVAALNPQAIPFWVFALAAISQYFVFEYVGIYLIGFLAGVFAGKLIALYGFIIASNYLKTHVQQSSLMVNRLLGGILILIGISQAWNVLLR